MNDRAVNLLENYDIEVLRTAKGRGAILCEAKQGYYIFKEYSGPQSKLKVQDEVLKTVSKECKVPVEQLVTTKEGELFVKDGEQTAYILKSYFSGRECNVRDMEDCRQAMRTLARLHKVMRIPVEHCEDFCQVFRIDAEYEKHNKELRKVRRFLRERSQKTDFELFLLGHYDFFLEKAIQVTEELLSYDMEKECMHTLAQGYICHGDYQYHNLLKNDKKMAVINFEKIVRDNPVRDLYLFLRKLLEKNNWNTELGSELISVYQKENPLSAHDCVQLYYRFAYPEKFWKIVNFYYNSGKAWIPEKNMEKLRKVIEGERNKQEFLDSIFSIIAKSEDGFSI